MNNDNIGLKIEENHKKRQTLLDQKDSLCLQIAGLVQQEERLKKESTDLKAQIAELKKSKQIQSADNEKLNRQLTSLRDTVQAQRAQLIISAQQLEKKEIKIENNYTALREIELELQLERDKSIRSEQESLGIAEGINRVNDEIESEIFQKTALTKNIQQSIKLLKKKLLVANNLYMDMQLKSAQLNRGCDQKNILLQDQMSKNELEIESLEEEKDILGKKLADQDREIEIWEESCQEKREKSGSLETVSVEGNTQLIQQNTELEMRNTNLKEKLAELQAQVHSRSEIISKIEVATAKTASSVIKNSTTNQEIFPKKQKKKKKKSTSQTGAQQQGVPAKSVEVLESKRLRLSDSKKNDDKFKQESQLGLAQIEKLETELLDNPNASRILLRKCYQVDEFERDQNFYLKFGESALYNYLSFLCFCAYLFRVDSSKENIDRTMVSLLGAASGIDALRQAQYIAGCCLERGFHVKKNLKRAKSFYNRAMQQGYKPAQKALRRIEEMAPTPAEKKPEDSFSQSALLLKNGTFKSQPLNPNSHSSSSSSSSYNY